MDRIVVLVVLLCCLRWKDVLEMVESECWMVLAAVVVLVEQAFGSRRRFFYHNKASYPIALTINNPLHLGINIGGGSFNIHQVHVYEWL